MMNYATLIGDKSTSGSIKSWQNYAKLDSEGILEEAQAMVYGRLRCREMKTSDIFPVRVGAASIDLPDGFLDPIVTKDITNNLKLMFREEEELEDMRSYTAAVLDSGDPVAFGVYDEAFNFDCKTTTAWSLKAVFYKTPDPLSTGNPTNFLTKRYPHLLRMACLATGARFAKDDALFAREQRLLYGEISEMTINDEMGGSTDVPVEI